MDRVIGFIQGLPVYETRAIVHDPHSGQFTSSGGGGKIPRVLPKLHSATHSGFGGSAHTAEGMAQKYAAAGDHAHAAAYYLEAATIKGSNGQSYRKQEKLYHHHASQAYKEAAGKADNEEHKKHYLAKAEHHAGKAK